jgi:hypothetical protein
MASQIRVFYLGGDVLLKVRNWPGIYSVAYAGPLERIYRVSAIFLRLSLPFLFNVLVDKEPALLTMSENPQPGHDVVVNLTVPYGRGFELLLGIIHHEPDDRVLTFYEHDRLEGRLKSDGDFPASSLTRIYELVHEAHIYKATHVLRPWIPYWLNALAQPDDERYITWQRLSIGWLLGDERLVNQSLDNPVFLSRKDDANPLIFDTPAMEPEPEWYFAPDWVAGCLIARIYDAIPNAQGASLSKRLYSTNNTLRQLTN